MYITINSIRPVKDDGDWKKTIFYLLKYPSVFLSTSFLSPILLFGHFAKPQKVPISFIMSVHLSVHMEQLSSHQMDFHEIWVFSKNMSRKFKFHYNLTWITGNLHEDQWVFMVISHWILLGMKNVSDKTYAENQNVYFMFNNFFPENCAAYEIM